MSTKSTLVYDKITDIHVYYDKKDDKSKHKGSDRI